MRDSFPYIGVTGFMTSNEVESFLDIVGIFDREKRNIMIGVLASLKTLKGQQPGNANRYPPVNKILDIFYSADYMLNLVHYNTSEPETLAEQLLSLLRYAGKNCHGFQLNMPWPDPRQIEAFKEADSWGEIPSEKKFVLQVGKKAFATVNSPTSLREMVRTYTGLADYVLLDPSGGTGVPFNEEVILGYLEKLDCLSDKIGIGVAGGLSPDNLEPCRKLLENFPYLSFDVESGVRNKSDKLSVIEAATYFKRLLEMIP